MLSWVVNYILQDAVNQNIYAKVKKLGSIFNFFLKNPEPLKFPICSVVVTG